MITYKTRSGSIYDVDGNMIRRRVRSAISESERVSAEWRQADSIRYDGTGYGLMIVWGRGRDEYSDAATQIGEGPEESRLRTTVTTAVVEVITDAELGQN